MDFNIAWNAHIKNTIKKVSKRFGIFSHLIDELPHIILHLSINELGLAHLLHCYIMCGCTHRSHINIHFTIQKNIRYCPHLLSYVVNIVLFEECSLLTKLPRIMP